MSGFSSFPFDALPALLLPWYGACARPLPWRETREPYRVWISEIMLQQTRSAAVCGYYARFLAELPDVAALAAVGEERLLKLWEGLGYYSRARNLKRAAEAIVAEHGGVFPREYDAIRALPGIGDYTAGAIASICFEQPTPAIDGNVLRIAARLADCADSVDAPETKRALRAALVPAYPAGQCGAFTQALMELGATVCLPNGAPLCGRCPAASLCRGRAHGTAKTLPVRAKKQPRRVETHTALLLISADGRTALCRPAGGALGAPEPAPNAWAAGGGRAGGNVRRKAPAPRGVGGIYARVHACGMARDVLPHRMCRTGRCRAGGGRATRLGGRGPACGRIRAARRLCKGMQSLADRGKQALNY